MKLALRFTDGRPAVSVFDNQAPGVKALVELMKQYPREDVHFVSGTDDGSKAIALVEADVDPGTFFLYDRATGKFTPLLQREVDRSEPTRTRSAIHLHHARRFVGARLRHLSARQTGGEKPADGGVRARRSVRNPRLVGIRFLRAGDGNAVATRCCR